MEVIRDSTVGYVARLLAPHKFRYVDEVTSAEASVEESTPSPRVPYNDSDSRKESPTDDSESNGDVKIDIPKTIICDWNGEDDPENPRNWSRARKLFVVANIALCSFVVYGTAPIWTPSAGAFMSEFGTGNEYTSLGLSLFV